MRWIGLDVHHLYIHVTELTDDGKVTHNRVAVSADGLAGLRTQLGADAQVVLEASTSSFRLHDVLKSGACSVVVAHPSQTRGASSLHVKTDMRDAEILARLLATGFVRPVWVPPSDCRALRGLLEFRSTLTTLHTMCVNQVKACFRAELLDYPSSLTKRRMQVACDVSWPEPHLALTVRSIVALHNCLHEQLRSIDAALEAWSEASPEAGLLRTIPGVGAVLAAAIVAGIGDISRFPDTGHLCAYAGLVPKVHASGKTLRVGKLAKGGRGQIRWALWMATLHLVRRDRRFQAVYQGLCSRRPKMVALVASARKLLVVIWHMLRRGEPFRHDPVVTSAGCVKDESESPGGSKPTRAARAQAPSGSTRGRHRRPPSPSQL
jgi:transposase